MGLQSRIQTDALAIATAKAHNDSRLALVGCASAPIFGSTVLVAGTKTVAQAGITSASVVFVMYTTSGGATQGVKYKVVCTAGQIVFTAVDNTGATVATDTSTLGWVAFTPAYHADQTPGATAGDFTNPTASLVSAGIPTAAGDITTAIASCNYIRQVLVMHYADAVTTGRLGGGAHKIVDATNGAGLGAVVGTTGVLATDTAAVVAAVNLHQTSYNAHLLQAGVHFNASDTANNNATTVASNLATATTLLNALAASIQAHMGSYPAGESVYVLPV